MKNFDGSVEKAEVIPHDFPVDLAIITSGFSQIEPEVEELLPKLNHKHFMWWRLIREEICCVYKHSNFALYPDLEEPKSTYSQ